MLSSTVVVDGHVEFPPYREQVSMLEEHLADLLQPIGYYLHGDVHLPNMLVGDDGDDTTFIDPRTVWDGHENDDPGFGDPLYDLGTLLHSVHVMSTILRAIDTKVTDSLLTVNGAESGVLHVQTGVLGLLESTPATAVLEYIGSDFPRELLGRNWPARLHANAANALVGWLKYQRALVTGPAWYAVLVSVLYHLDQARQRLDR